MSTKSRTQCDVCGIPLVEDWDTKRGWPRVYHGLKVQDFCNQCWEPIMKIMRRNFVDALLLEAQGVKEEIE